MCGGNLVILVIFTQVHYSRSELQYWNTWCELGVWGWWQGIFCDHPCASATANVNLVWIYTMLELKLSQRWPASQLMSLNYHSPSQSHWIIGDGCGGATSENWINLYMKRDSEAQNENVWNIVATQIDVQKLCAELLTCTQ